MDKSKKPENQHLPVTEIFVTKVSEDNTQAYRKWVKKIYDAESQFPGFLGVHVQPPTHGDNWVTLLQFDSQKHLDQWLTSQKRQEILKESETLVTSLEAHRVFSPFAGWFAKSPIEKIHAPSVWKQTCLILLVLFPMVMLQRKFLSPFLEGLNPSVATFIANTISVILISWPMMPIAIYFLEWWLKPIPEKQSSITLKGIFMLLVLYLLEIFAFA